MAKPLSFIASLWRPSGSEAPTPPREKSAARGSLHNVSNPGSPTHLRDAIEEERAAAKTHRRLHSDPSRFAPAKKKRSPASVVVEPDTEEEDVRRPRHFFSFLGAGPSSATLGEEAAPKITTRGRRDAVARGILEEKESL